MASPNTIAITPGTAKSAGFALTTAQTDKTGATGTNIVTVLTASSTLAISGALVQDIIINATATTAAACILIWHNIGGTRYLIKEILVSATTGSATAIGWTSGTITLNRNLAAGDKIDIQTTVTQTYSGSCNYGEY